MGGGGKDEDDVEGSTSRVIFYDPIKHIVLIASERDRDGVGLSGEKQKTISDMPFTYANEIDV